MESVVPGVSSVVPSDVSQHIDPRLTSMFVKPPALVGTESSFTQFVEPMKTISNSDTEIILELPNTGSLYVDLKNTSLYVKGSLKKRDGTALADDDATVLTNNALYSLFEAVTVYVGHNKLELYTGDFHYKSFIKQLMRNSTLTPVINDQGMEIEFLSNSFANDAEVGSGRAERTFKSATTEFMGPTLIDFFHTDGYLLPSTPLKVKFRRSSDLFYVVTPPAHKDVPYFFEIQKMGLFVPCINISPALTPLLEMQTTHLPASYDFDNLKMRQLPLQKDTVVQKFKRVLEGRLPQRILVGIYKHAAFSGQRDLSPLLTASLEVSEISLMINGVVVREATPLFDEKLYMETYRHFLSWMTDANKGYYISYEIFKSGYRFFSFDLLENCPPTKPCGEEMLTQGTMGLSVRFPKPLDEHYIMTFFYISPDTVELTKERVAHYTAAIE